MDYNNLIQWMEDYPEFATWRQILPDQIAQALCERRWGDLPAWRASLDQLPELTSSDVDFSSSARIGTTQDCSLERRRQLKDALMGLHPWRKGPWNLFGLPIDTEWRSDWKWDRLYPHLGNLENQHVLDVGCGNGYHCARLYGAGAARVIGIDPSVKFVFQFYAIKKYCPDIPVDVLPLGIEELPEELLGFDTVLSMGVLYHRRDPLVHLRELIGCLKPGGTLVVETLVIDSDKDCELAIHGRYAKMRNIWSIPSPGKVLHWMNQLGLVKPQMVDLCITTLDEQRRTEWMRFESLSDFLDPTNPQLTIEGYPAPQRAIFTAHTQ